MSSSTPTISRGPSGLRCSWRTPRSRSKQDSRTRSYNAPADAATRYKARPSNARHSPSSQRTRFNTALWVWICTSPRRLMR